ncbi:unnamed protein product [Ixodes persulcatus]
MAAGVSEFLFTFSLNLYKQLHADHGARGNILCSPFGVAAVLSMTLAGARNNTEKQILNVLQANNGSDRTVHEQFEAILDRLETLAPDVSLFIANRIYALHEFTPLPGYASLLQKHYHSSLETVDFQKNPDGVRRKMNSWVELKTGSRIKDFFPPGTLSPGTCLVALNAVFFKGLWESQFSAEFTSKEEFHGADGTAKMVDLMSQRGKFRMAHSRELGATALEIPYKGARVFMVVLLPDARDGLPAFERKVTPSKLSTLLGGMTEVTKVRLRLPKFKLSQTVDLRSALTSMGAADLFTEHADLSGVSASGGLTLSSAVHKAVLEVNEEGTEAAAASGVVMTRRAIEGIDFTVDHPFFFVLRTRDPGVVLFAGSVREL